MATGTPEMRIFSLEEQVVEIVRELLKELGSLQAVRLEASLDRDLGLGSMERVELLVRCEARFNRRLPDGIAQETETLADWVRAMRDSEKPEAGESPYRIVQPNELPPPAPESARSFAEVLRRHAEAAPDRVHIHLLDKENGKDITYGQLLETASRVAAGLQAAGLRHDETVAMMLPTCDDFFYAFFGVMLAGGIPVPIYPPARPDKIEEYVNRQSDILRNAGVRFLISFPTAKHVARILQLGIPSLADVTTVETLAEYGKLPLGGVSEPSDTAFIQYTSGSTGDPKGVVLSQSNILANVRSIGWAVQVKPTDIGVTWLPLYHDMGLIGSWLFTLYYALPITVLSPLDFLSRPERWLWAMHNSGGTLCPAPNFSFELCARKIPDSALAGLDLSAWRVAINAGEAVLPDTLARFEDRFRPYGFRAESYIPCYGLAESSVALVFPPINRRPVIDTIRRDRFEREGIAEKTLTDGPNGMRFVANGKPLPEHEIKIVDEEGRELGERLQGRLLFRGLSKTSGYYCDPEATAAVTTEDGWMDSGDLAYWAGGELYITGRVKDCIIKFGRNINPQDVEAAAAEVAGVRRGCVAAFGSVDSVTGTERLVVVGETRLTAREDRRRIKKEIAQKVEAVLGIPPDRVILTAPQTIPKTSSGKIRRGETRRVFEGGMLQPTRRPLWLQIGRLGLQHMDEGIQFAFRQGKTNTGAFFRGMLWVGTALLSGIILRLLPGRKLKAKFLRPAARSILAFGKGRIEITGRVIGKGEAAKTPSVFVANCSSSLDPLVLPATLPSPLLMAESVVLTGTAWPTAFLLKPLLIPPLCDARTPPGGTLRERARHMLKNGYSLLVFPEGRAGMPPHRSRFRLEAFHAATENGTPIVPVSVEGTSSLFGANENTATNESVRPKVRLGVPITTEMQKNEGVAGLRARVRDAISKLSAETASENSAGAAR